LYSSNFHKYIHLRATAITNYMLAPSRTTLAVQHAMGLIFGGRAKDWYMKQRRVGIVWGSLDAMAAAFKAHFCTEVRFSKQDARMQLMRGEVKQGKSTVQEYSSKFQMVVLRAADMSMTDQILWYMQGLSPALAERCASDGYPVSPLRPGDAHLYSYSLHRASRTTLLSGATSETLPCCIGRRMA
jgi:hypothetical protein